MSNPRAIFASRFLVPFLSLGLLAGCDLVGEPGNGQRVTEARSAAGFTNIEATGSLDVDVMQGDAFAVTVSIDSNLIDRVETRVSGDTLVVDVRGSISSTVSGPQVLVTMPVLADALASGSGGIRIHPFTQGADVTLRASGSGGVDAEETAPRVRAEASGSGDIHVSGSAQRIEIAASGSGGVNAVDLDAGEGAIDLSGSGGASATIHGAADVSLSGSGDLELHGGATVTQLSESGSGRLHLGP
jgi:hypothetical protein